MYGPNSQQLGRYLKSEIKQMEDSKVDERSRHMTYNPSNKVGTWALFRLDELDYFIAWNLPIVLMKSGKQEEEILQGLLFIKSNFN